MTQLPSAIPAEPDPQSASAVVSGKHVCPFCGTIGEKADRPCARCLMEDTPQTRQSTRWRMGPWYVLQSRNPSAPGMKYTTLLALIRKGQISAKTIIRGPSTQQFWRFAGTVRGVSREFGICWSCGICLAATATACPRCTKGQEIPANPDVLLENDPADGKPLFVDISPKSGAPIPKPVVKEAAGASNGPRSPGGSDPFEIRRPGSKSSRPSSPVPSSAAVMAIAAGLTPPELAAPEHKSRPNQQLSLSNEKILSARDLAAAFSLQFKSDPVLVTPPPPPGKRAGRLLALAVVLLILMGGITVMSIPTWRVPTLAWLHRMAGSAQTTPSPSSPSDSIKIDSADRPDWAMNPPVDSKPVSTSPQQPAPSAVTPTGQVTASPDKSSSSDSSPVQQLATPIQHIAPVSPGTSGAELDALAMRLRSNGLDAEGRRDFAAAQYYYEQIEKLPRDHWPADTDQLLKAAQKMNQSASTDQR